ncbi:hypothetical protein, partial [Enterobacter hormaechei]|uniref:hypothetical protein n=1 Tax=Enterobacter hormaechei TaxID=158836 RepID=UPI002044D21C
KRAYCLKTQPATGETYPKSDLFNKALENLKSAIMFALNKNVFYTWMMLNFLILMLASLFKTASRLH